MKSRSLPLILALSMVSFSIGVRASQAVTCDTLILGQARSKSAPVRAIEAIKNRFSPPVITSDKTIPTEALRQIRDVADEILKRFPPQEYAYVGVGRSPSALMAFMKALGLEQIFNVPLTGVRGANVLSEEDRELLFQHFDLFAPNSRRSHLRKVVLIDYVQSGKSALRALELFKNYYSNQHEKFEVTMFNMLEPIHEIAPFDPDEDYMMDEVYDPRPLQPEASIFEYPHVQLEKCALADLLKRQDSDMYGEFGSYRIGASGNDLSVLMVSSPSYVKLVREFKWRIPRELNDSAP